MIWRSLRSSRCGSAWGHSLNSRYRLGSCQQYSQQSLRRRQWLGESTLSLLGENGGLPAASLDHKSTFRSCTTRHLNTSAVSTTKTIHTVASALKETSNPATQVTVQAIIRTIRNQKKHSFAKLGDGSTAAELQVLLSPSQAEGLTTGTVVQISGSLEACPPGLKQTHELHANQVTIIGPSHSESYPIQKKYHSAEFLRTLPHLRLRTPWNALLARLRSDVEHSCSQWFHENGYLRVHPPIITSSDCEGAGEVFTVAPDTQIPAESPQDNQHFFKTPKYLTVSSQLHLEAYAHVHRAVWTLSPTFRAERSDTPRHLSEFYMLEAELQTTSLSEVMDVVESLLRHVSASISISTTGREMLSYSTHTNTQTPGEDVSPDRRTLLSQRWSSLNPKEAYPRITYTEAITHLQSAASAQPDLFTYIPTWGNSLALEHERYLASSIGSGNTPIFVTDYPSSIKPFYMPPSSLSTTHTPSPGSESSQGKERETTSSFDLLLPHLAELAGGSLREHRLSALKSSMQRKGVSAQNLDWYLDLREYGSVPHGGFGLGFDRLLCFLAGEGSVRDVVGWPRWVGRCDG